MQILKFFCFALTLFALTIIVRPFEGANAGLEGDGYVITLIDDGEISYIWTVAETVEEFLILEEIDYAYYDFITPHMRNRFSSGVRTVEIRRAFPLYITIDDRHMMTMALSGMTAGDVTAAVQRAIGGALILDGDIDAPIEYGAKLSFSSWEYQTEIELNELEYETRIIYNPNLSIGIELILQEGELGQETIENRLVYVGEELKSLEQNTVAVSPPQERIIEVGTGVIDFRLGRLTDTSSPLFDHVTRIVMNASAYTAEECCTGKSPGDPYYGITASGRRVEHGIVAVDPRVIPMGTRLYVEGYGFALAADVGGAIVGNRIDLFMESLYAARQFGRRAVTVFILD